MKPKSYECYHPELVPTKDDEGLLIMVCEACGEVLRDLGDVPPDPR